ncbi:MAG: hypothetical protein P9X27_04845, partial [Candidatus Kaelpia aquatica]|nr:hypothetical protein [Candidatus Kaelpia aquatica]
MRYSRFLVVILFVVSLVISQVGFQSQDVCRRVQTGEFLDVIQLSVLPVIDNIDGVVRVNIRLTGGVKGDAATLTTFAAFIRSIAHNKDIEVASITTISSAENIAHLIQTCDSLGPWRGVSVTADGSDVVINSTGEEIRIPVINLGDVFSADICMIIGPLAQELSITPEQLGVQRIIAVVTGLDPIDLYEEAESARIPGEISEDDDMATVPVSEIAGLGIVLGAIDNNLGNVNLSRANLFLPQGDMAIRPLSDEIDLSGMLEKLHLQNTGASLHVTEVSGAIQGARRVEAILTVNGNVLESDLIALFNITSNISVASQDVSTSSMFNSPYETSSFILDPEQTSLTQMDGYTRITLCGWVGNYSMAGMVIDSVTEVGRQLAESNLLSTQDAITVYPNLDYPLKSVLSRARSVMINGAAGRIGRNILRILKSTFNDSESDWDLVAVNGVRSAAALVDALTNDEVLGPVNAQIEIGSTTVEIPRLDLKHYVDVDGQRHYVSGKNEANRLADTLRSQFEGREIEADIAIGELLSPQEDMVEVEVEYVEVNGNRIYIFNEREDTYISTRLPYLFEALDLEMDFMWEASGNYKSPDRVKPFLDAGFQRIGITAPASGGIIQIVVGVNDGKLLEVFQDSGIPTVVSSGSCTTNNVAPVAQAFVDMLAEEGTSIVRVIDLKTIHAGTQTQAGLLPQQLKNPSKADRIRAAVTNIVPTTTGAAKVLPDIIEGVDTILGSALRVGNPNGSETEVVFYLDGICTLSKEEIIANLQFRARTDMLNVLAVNTGIHLSSSDINGADVTSIVEADSIDIVPIYDGANNHVSDAIVVNTWYDNEFGYTRQFMRTMTMWALLEENPGLTREELLDISNVLGENAYVPG